MISLYSHYNGTFLFSGSEFKCLEYMDMYSYQCVNKYQNDWYVETY